MNRGVQAAGVAATLTLGLALIGAPHPDRPSRPAASAGGAIVQVASPTAPTATPPPAAAPPPAPSPPRTASVVMGGDLLWHDTVWISAAHDHEDTGRGADYDFDPMFAAVRPMIEAADVAICHEEVPFAAPGQAPRSYPVFAAPPEAAAWIGSMGWDACTTASNHTVDQGYDGLVRTADLLEQAGVAHVGTFRSPQERRTPVILTTGQGVRVAIVAGTFGLNGFPVPEGRPWSVSMWDADDLLAQARRAKEAGADIVVAHLHGGDEYSHLPNAEQEGLVDALTRSPDVDVVLGEHAHVVQPVTRVNGKWVAYGLGNLVAQSEISRPSAYQGILIDLTFTERASGGFRVSRAAYVPVEWNNIAAGPIRVGLADASGRQEIAEAVNGLGGNRGLVAEGLA